MGAVSATVLLLVLSPAGEVAGLTSRDVDLSDFLILVALYSIVAVICMGLHVLLSELFTSPIPSFVIGLYAAFLPVSTVFWMSLLEGPLAPGEGTTIPMLTILAVSSAVAGMLASELSA